MLFSVKCKHRNKRCKRLLALDFAARNRRWEDNRLSWQSLCVAVHRAFVYGRISPLQQGAGNGRQKEHHRYAAYARGLCMRLHEIKLEAGKQSPG